MRDGITPGAGASIGHRCKPTEGHVFGEIWLSRGMVTGSRGKDNDDSACPIVDPIPVLSGSVEGLLITECELDCSVVTSNRGKRFAEAFLSKVALGIERDTGQVGNGVFGVIGGSEIYPKVTSAPFLESNMVHSPPPQYQLSPLCRPMLDAFVVARLQRLPSCRSTLTAEISLRTLLDDPRSGPAPMGPYGNAGERLSAAAECWPFTAPRSAAAVMVIENIMILIVLFCRLRRVLLSK